MKYLFPETDEGFQWEVLKIEICTFSIKSLMRLPSSSNRDLVVDLANVSKSCTDWEISTANSISAQATRVPELIESLKSSTFASFQVEAIEKLGRIDSSEAVPVLVEALGDDSSIIRKAIFEGVVDWDDHRDMSIILYAKEAIDEEDRCGRRQQQKDLKNLAV